MLQFRDESLIKESIECFEAIMRYMGDMSLSKKLMNKTSIKDMVAEVVGRGLAFPELRDEIFVQLAKQTTKNPK